MHLSIFDIFNFSATSHPISLIFTTKGQMITRWPSSMFRTLVFGQDFKTRLCVSVFYTEYFKEPDGSVGKKNRVLYLVHMYSSFILFSLSWAYGSEGLSFLYQTTNNKIFCFSFRQLLDRLSCVTNICNPYDQ